VSAPLSAGAATRAQLAGVLRSRTFAYTSVGGGAVALVAGAAWGGTTGALAAPAAVLAVTLLIAWAEARRNGRFAFWSGMARSMGLSFVGRVDGVQPLTPMLAAGDRRHAEAWMVGPGLWGAGLWTFSRGNGDDRRDFDRTIAVVEVPAATGLYPGVFLYHGLTSESARHHRRHTRVSLESGALAQRYVVLRADGVGELQLRELLSPSLIAWLAEHPLAPEIEICGGAVLVAVTGHRADAGTIVTLVDVARELARRVQREVDEELAAGRAVPGL
jgi:hypothetical protein